MVVNAEPDKAGPSDEPLGGSGARAVKDKGDEGPPAITVTDAGETAQENRVPAEGTSNVQVEVAAIETDRQLNNARYKDQQPPARSSGDEARMETEQVEFKAPVKRKKSGKTLSGKQAKKVNVTELSDEEETESDGESSDSSISISQRDFSGRRLEVDDIKLFLRATKNKRGVNVKEYFPDVKQLIEETKGFMMEGSFTNKEVYRLKNIGRKLNSELSIEDSEGA